MIASYVYRLVALPVIALAAWLFYLVRRRSAEFKELFEQSPEAAVLTSAGDRVIRINHRFTQIFGYAPLAAVGRQLAELIVPAEALDDYLRQVELAAQGQRIETEGVRCRKDGTRFPAAIALAPFPARGAKSAVYAVYRDVTGQKRAEAEHWNSEARWHAIFDNAAVGISVTDPDGNFVATNRAYQEIVGYSQEELAQHSYMDLTVEEDRPASATLAAANWSGLRPQFQLEKRYQRKDGQTIWVRITVSKASGAKEMPQIGVAIVEDITERRRTEARLSEYAKVVEGLPEMILVIDREYRYLIANQAYLNYRGLDREQVVGHVVPEMTGQAVFDDPIKSKMDECLQGKLIHYELRLPYPVTGERDIAATYFPIEGPNGIDRVAMVLQDITEKKRAERDLQRSLEELHALTAKLQSVREEERTRLARELHDRLGQALTAIKIDLAALKTMPLQVQPRGIEAILRLIDETIHSVRRISTELRPGILDDLGLVAAVEWAAEEFQGRTGVRCHLNLPAEIADIGVERATALFRIFQETLTNIARHSGATQARITLSCGDDYLALEVADNGCGLGEGQLSASNSLGILGMRERALLLGGEFSIAGAGGGATVSVRIPVGPGGQREGRL